MTFRTLLLAAGAAILGVPVVAHASLVQVSSIPGDVLNPVVFNDARGSASATPLSYTSAGQTATFSTNDGNLLERDQANVAGDSNPYIDSNFGTGTQLIAQCGFAQSFSCNPAGSVTITFARPTVGFTVSADDFDTTQAYTFTVAAFSGATLVGSLTASSLADNGASPAVLAGLSSTPITSLVITDTAASFPDGDFVLGNIATVPEPGSLGVLLAGLVGIGGLARRRSRQ